MTLFPKIYLVLVNIVLDTGVQHYGSTKTGDPHGKDTLITFFRCLGKLFTIFCTIMTIFIMGNEHLPEKQLVSENLTPQLITQIYFMVLLKHLKHAKQSHTSVHI